MWFLFECNSCGRGFTTPFNAEQNHINVKFAFCLFFQISPQNLELIRRTIALNHQYRNNITIMKKVIICQAPWTETAQRIKVSYFKRTFLVSSILPKNERKQFDPRYYSSAILKHTGPGLIWKGGPGCLSRFFRRSLAPKILKFFF